MKSEVRFHRPPIKFYAAIGLFAAVIVVSSVIGSMILLPDVWRVGFYGLFALAGVGAVGWIARQSQQIRHQAEMNRLDRARARYLLIPKSTSGVIDLDSKQTLVLPIGPTGMVIDAPAVEVERRRSVFDLLTTGPHFALIGGTDSGKTTLANHLIDAMADPSAVVFALDPDARFNVWSPRCQVVSDYEEIEMTLYQNLLEMDQRRRAGPGDYPLVIIAMDEWPAVVDECSQAAGYLKRLSRQGRKVGFRLILLSQSDLVEDIGNNSSVKENFIKIAMRPDLTRQNLATIRHWDRSTELVELAGTYGVQGRWFGGRPAGLSLPEPEPLQPTDEERRVVEFVELVQGGLSRSEASQQVFGKPYAGTSHVARLREALLLAGDASTG